MSPTSTPTHPPSPRWTHIALPCTDIDAIDRLVRASTRRCELLDRREDADGQGAWLGQPDMVDKPFILVLVSFFRDQGKGPQPIMAPFAHIGIELPSHGEIDAIAAQGEARGLPGVAADARCRRRSATSAR